MLSTMDGEFVISHQENECPLQFAHVGAHVICEQNKESKTKTKMESEIFVCTLFRVHCGQPLMGTVGLDLMLWSPKPYRHRLCFNVRVGFLSCLPNLHFLSSGSGVVRDWVRVGRPYLSTSEIDRHYQFISPMYPVTMFFQKMEPRYLIFDGKY